MVEKIGKFHFRGFFVDNLYFLKFRIKNVKQIHENR
ncbi:hypothetical protein Echvi_4163 [Echinicola vietnamensis DSM 17526]|uniref:Uncharacterized protein n=1 Tax=Echinicola vietnamensis (strain DSM 17526 / LMG 23754 / KMM 6221) TaxID=926556 RepID=L0G496_ECHVK|nr:hypothetical protein Echvi_4163 [Echinicola vietnamensis DSM 17526]